MEHLLKNNPEKYIQIYADCIPVRGATKSAFYDLTRQELTSFPTPYYDLLGQLVENKNENLIEKINLSNEKEAIYDLIAFLFEFEFAFMTDKPARFPEIEPGWETPRLINNAIVDIDLEIHDMGKILNELDELGCQFLQVRCFSNLLSLTDFNKIIDNALHKSIEGIELILKFDPTISDKAYKKFIERNPIVSSLCIHSSPKSRDLNIDFDLSEKVKQLTQKTIQFTEQCISSESHCGVINLTKLSSPSVPVFFENLEYNGCLNRKIAVDRLGNIKNCPSMNKIYGNIKQDSLEVAIEDSEFKKAWLMNKDQIDTCRDCELRYICSDCRAYTQDQSIDNAKPLKCKYNPYSGQWSP